MKNNTFPQIQTRPKRRTLNRLALALTALAVGAAGQHFLGRGSLWDGLLFYVIAIALFIRAVSRPAVAVTTPVNLSLDVQCGWRRNVGVWLMLLGLGASAIGYNFFGMPNAQAQAWALYLTSLTLFMGGGLLLTATGWSVPPLRRPRLSFVGWAILVILGVALFMRLYHFTNQPFGIWYDEAEAGLQARQLLQQPAYRPILYAPINITGHLLTLYALALHWLGDNIYSMRLVSVLFGLGGVLTAYLFGRELHGQRFGLILAFLLAVARWHVNFSRIAMTGIDTPFFEFLSLFFLLRLWRRGHLRDAMWAGLALGFGLMFYTAFRLFIVALLLFALLAALLWRRQLLQTDWRAHLLRLMVMGIAAWLVVMPLAHFARHNPEAFWYRTRQISILTKRDQADLTTALWSSTQKHLLMFNFEGDKNGRHNLPGAPMLDPATGLLAVLGLGLALTGLKRRPANLFFLILFPMAMSGGILSVDFEAPQSLRSIAVMPAVFYFVALSLSALGREAEQSLRPLPLYWQTVPAAALLGFILFSNAHTYFNVQANDFAAWNAFSAPETITGLKMAELGPEHRYYLSPFLANHPTTRFIAPNIPDQYHLPLPDALPIRQTADRPVTLFIHPDDEWVFATAQAIYPNADFEVARGRAITGEGPPVVYLATLQPDDLAAVQGLSLSYHNPDRDDATPPLLTERPATLHQTWPADSPLVNQAQADWRGILFAPTYGPYSLRLSSPGPANLEIDGTTVISGSGELLAGIRLAQGNHTLRLQSQVQPGLTALYWQPPGQPESLVPQWALYQPGIGNHGLQGSYFANDNWAGQPALQRIDPFLDLYFHFTPLPRPYTVEWAGALDVPQNGLYRLGLRAVTEAQLYLDNQLLITTTAPDQTTEAALTLQAGLHNLRVLFADTTDRSRIHLTWTTPNGLSGPIPPENLWPPMGSYPPQAPPPPQPEVKALSLNWLTSLGSPGREPGQFFEPRDVAVLGNGNLVVADTVNRRVQILTPQGEAAKILTGDDLPFAEPLAVAVNSRDEILVLDSTQQWVYRYDAAGNFIDRFGGPAAFLFHPRGLTVAADDSVIIADTGQARLALFSADGTPSGAIGGKGDGPGQFDEPTDALRDKFGNYIVAEAMNNRLQRVDANGVHLNQWAIPPAYAFNGPHLTFGPDDSLFVTESQSQSLLRYSPDGALLEQWRTIGPVSLGAPVGIYFDSAANRLYITDVWTHQIHIFDVIVEASG